MSDPWEDFSFVLCIASFLFSFVLEERPHVIQAIVSACRCGTKAWRWPELRWPTSMRSCECCADDGLSLLWLGINQLAKDGMGRSEENYLGQPSCQWGNFRSFPFSNFLAQVTCYGHWCVPCLQLCIKTAWSPGVSVAAQLLPRLLGTDAALYYFPVRSSSGSIWPLRCVFCFIIVGCVATCPTFIQAMVC